MLAAAGQQAIIKTTHGVPSSAALVCFQHPRLLPVQVYKPATPENHRADVIFLRDYSEGVMQRETVLRVADKDAQRKALKAVAKEQKRTDRKASQNVSWWQVPRAQSAVLLERSWRPLQGLAGVWRDRKLLHHQR